MNSEEENHVFGNAFCRLLMALLCTTLTVQPSKAQQRQSQLNVEPSLILPFLYVSSTVPDVGTASDDAITIPSGTILPVRLNSTISSAKCRRGQVITGRTMQDVPLLPGVRIREGAKVIGHIVEVTPATSGARARISLQFDRLVYAHQT